MEYNGFKVVINTIDSKESYNNGALVLFTRSLTFKDSGTHFHIVISLGSLGKWIICIKLLPLSMQMKN